MPGQSDYRNNVEHHREEARAYYRAHRKERLAYAKRYREANKKKLAAKRKQYVQEHHEVILAKGRAYREKHLEKRRAAARAYRRAHLRHVWNYQLWYRHGLTVPEYRALHQKQHGCCAICGKKPRHLVVDHNHITGKVRGLLCHHCNSLLGFASDSTASLKAAIRYLASSA